ncbi:hypothetical protein [Bacillus cereus group sp. BfR-BA-01317]|uniref:hypothetical protein n=1 Tax=Bacillus cereus group sp. BfR-BA-01317 TaxID=2920294 RepID=UPI001F578925|nr:hypothetical protein [Bacillus cereus group sp. BfR-BA-01317]
MMNKITCTCGQDSIEVNKGSLNKELMDAGWGVIPTNRGAFVYICPSCYKRAKQLIKEFHQITQDTYISISSIIRKIEEENETK